ncbi:MAG: hypothetical protein H7Y04_15120 [Verrucomicrobia bacterium]|nr:hypothetical protein [Cytophagales bacterium]
MRLVAHLPHPDFKITLYAWNGKYLIKIETAMYEQTYKVKEFDVANEEEIKKLLDKTFMDAVAQTFNLMDYTMNEAFERINDNT